TSCPSAAGAAPPPPDAATAACGQAGRSGDSRRVPEPGNGAAGTVEDAVELARESAHAPNVGRRRGNLPGTSQASGTARARQLWKAGALRADSERTRRRARRNGTATGPADGASPVRRVKLSGA